MLESIHIGKSLKAAPKAKTCQRVWLPKCWKKEARTYNIVYDGHAQQKLVTPHIRNCCSPLQNCNGLINLKLAIAYFANTRPPPPKRTVINTRKTNRP
jgi:hypothetical protein